MLYIYVVYLIDHTQIKVINIVYVFLFMDLYAKEQDKHIHTDIQVLMIDPSVFTAQFTPELGHPARSATPHFEANN